MEEIIGSNARLGIILVPLTRICTVITFRVMFLRCRVFHESRTYITVDVWLFSMRHFCVTGLL